jgi:hypothetical protein
MLDELLAMSAVSRQKSGRIRLSARKIAPPMGSRELTLLGDQGRALLDTLCHDLHDAINPMFLGTATGRKISPQVFDLLLQRIHTQSREFLSRIDDQFKHPPRARKTRSHAEPHALGVTVFTYRDPFAGRYGRR